MTNFGFKKLSLENWLQPDEASTIFASISSDGQVKPITEDEWLRRILEPSLAEVVPLEIRRLFEVARSAMAYGYFFYPLYTLAAEQLFRVVETAISYKCQSMGAPTKNTNTFQEKINWLISQGVIPKSEEVRWQAIRGLRNMASHPQTQIIRPPSNAISVLRDVVEKVNLLF